jgi:hypothetical protein
MPVYNPLNLIFGDVLSPSRAATLETQWRLARERARPLGGIADVGVTSTNYVDVPGVVIARIDEAATAQLHVMGLVSGGTGWFRLWNLTTGAVVAGSETSFTSTTPTLQVTGDLELAAGDYKLQTKIGAAPDNVVVYGAVLVTQ